MLFSGHYLCPSRSLQFHLPHRNVTVAFWPDQILTYFKHAAYCWEEIWQCHNEITIQYGN